jgi:hypothetical protein
MSLDAVKAALEGQLNTMTPALATAWENSDFAPTVGTPFQAVNLLPAEPDNPVYGSNYQERGLLQVTLNYPVGKGAKDAIARAKLIRESFQRGLSLVKSGITTTIERTPEIGPGSSEGPWYQLPVRVRFYANVPS